jgi:hypothetical protein
MQILKNTTTLALFFLASILIGRAQNAVLSGKKYIYNNGRETIDLSLKRLNMPDWDETISIVDSIQIDGLGAKELLIFRQGKHEVHNFYGNANNQGKAYFSAYEIWSLDEKRQLFGVLTNYYEDVYDQEIRSMPPTIVGSESYSCKFSIDSLGVIRITNAKQYPEAPLPEPNISVLPAHGARRATMPPGSRLHNGTYQFIDGKYRLQ